MTWRLFLLLFLAKTIYGKILFILFEIVFLIYYVYRLNFLSNGIFHNSNHILSSFTEILILPIINFYYLTSFAMSDPVNTTRS